MILFISTINTIKAAEKSIIPSDSSIIKPVMTENKLVQDSKTMSLRLVEIQKMDKSLMTSSEKKVLRQEVRSINNAQVKNGGGVYLSVGAVIIILLLLIILL